MYRKYVSCPLEVTYGKSVTWSPRCDTVMAGCDPGSDWTHASDANTLIAVEREGSEMNRNRADTFSHCWAPCEGRTHTRRGDEIFCSLSDLLGFTAPMCSTSLHPTFHKVDKMSG